MDARRDYRSLWWRTFGRMLVIYLAPVLVLAVIGILQYQRLATTSHRAHLMAIADTQAGTLELFLRERISNLLNLADDPAIQPFAAQTSSDAGLDRLRRESPSFVDLGLFDERGTLVRYSGPHPELIGRNYDQESWFQRLAGSDERFVITDMYLGPKMSDSQRRSAPISCALDGCENARHTNGYASAFRNHQNIKILAHLIHQNRSSWVGFRGLPHFTIAVRPLDVNGIAALRATLDPAAITRFLRQAQGADDATTVVVNRDGRPQMIDLPSPIRGHAGVLAPPHETSSGWAMVDERGLRFGYAYRWLGLTDWALLTVPVDPQRTRSFNDAGLMLGAVSAAFILAGFSTILIRSRTVVRRLKRQDNEQARLSDELHHAARLASVGELAAGIAHEINDPLAIITEEAGLIRDLLDPEISGSGPTEDLLPHLETIRVRDVMVPLDEVPRVRDDESLASAVVALHRARIGGDGHRPPLRLVLVENGDGHVIGRIGHLAFLRSMFETRPFSGSDDAALERANVDTETLRSMSDHLRFLREEILGCCERADFILARDAMVPLDDSVDGSCSLGDGVHLLVTHQRLSVPVRENGKLVGLLRLADVFDHIAVLLESRPATR